MYSIKTVFSGIYYGGLKINTYTLHYNKGVVDSPVRVGEVSFDSANTKTYSYDVAEVSSPVASPVMSSFRDQPSSSYITPTVISSPVSSPNSSFNYNDNYRHSGNRSGSVDLTGSYRFNDKTNTRRGSVNYYDNTTGVTDLAQQYNTRYEPDDTQHADRPVSDASDDDDDNDAYISQSRQRISYSRPLPPDMRRLSLSEIKPVQYQSIVKQPNQFGDPYESTGNLLFGE